MQNFAIQFEYAWLLLLLIPAAVLIFFPYFRISKKYRRNRNRVTSVVLHSLVMLFAILTLAGMTFTYSIPNDENEIILLVDVSDTTESVQDKRDDFVETAIRNARFQNLKVGVVTFGFGQVYAVPITDDLDTVYDAYLAAPLPNTSATDIAAALEYTKGLFTNPESGKIVLVSDGKETDEEANSVIRAISAQGIIVDTAYIQSVHVNTDVQIGDVRFPEYHMNVGEEFDLTVELRGNVTTDVVVDVYDNGDPVGTQPVKMSASTQEFSVPMTFHEEGLHDIRVELRAGVDQLEENNVFQTYYNLEVYDNILIFETFEGDSDLLKETLEAKDYKVTVVNLRQGAEIPTTVDELRMYDQVIMNNVANADFPVGLDEALQSYVSDYGGGMFTVGGADEKGEAHAYNRKDMYGTKYQSMLPVQAINYTPPVGVVVIIDRSGSMGGGKEGELSKLDWARAGAFSCLDAMTERDYFGLMTLDSEYGTVLSLTPRSRDSEIRAAIDSVNEATGGTQFYGAIDRAGQELRALKAVDRRHIIIVTDGQPGDQKIEGDEKYLYGYEKLINEYYEADGTTVSIVLIGDTANSSAGQQMKRATDFGHGRLHAIDDAEKLVYEMREDLNVPEIKEVNQETFEPIVYDKLSPLVSGLERDPDAVGGERLNVSLDGFYGVKVRKNDYLVLTGDFEVPVYAQWKYGKGMVGSFMCDLSGRWSASFLSSNVGTEFLYNVVGNLLPLENIRPNEITVELIEENYINRLSVVVDLKDGETVTGEIKRMDAEKGISLNAATGTTNAGAYVTLGMTDGNHYSRCQFVVSESGVYEILLQKKDAQGNVLAEYVTYKQFSYSEEYDIGADEKIDPKAFLSELAVRGGGSAIEDIEDPIEIYENLVTEFHREFDPRYLFIILAIVLFLLDVAVRKFKFKWPHELIRAYKEKKAAKAAGQSDQTIRGEDGI